MSVLDVKLHMNRKVGRVTPSTLRSSAGLVSALGISATEDGCAPFFALSENVVAAVGAQRTAPNHSPMSFPDTDESSNSLGKVGGR